MSKIRMLGLSVVMLFVAFIISSCASAGANRATRSQLLQNLNKRDFKSAENFVNDAKFYPEENSALLKLLERGTVQYLSGNYYQALQTLEQAQKLSDELFTKSISKAIGATIGSASSDNYYGTRYERSLIRFYESLVHYNLYKTGKYEAYSQKDNEGKVTQIPAKTLSDNEKTTHLSQARSILLEWDTLLSSYNKELAGKAVYKADLVQKLYAAFVHEEFGTSGDRQIALQLYKDAKDDVLLKYYNLYPNFNEKSNDFSKNFNNLSKMSLEKIKADFIKPTANADDLNAFIDSKIAKLSGNNKDNFTVVLKDGFVAPKKAKKVIVAMIPSFTHKIEPDDIFIPVPPQVAPILAAIGTGQLNEFLVWALVGGIIEFEIPYIVDSVNLRSYKASLTGKNGSPIDFPIVLLDPMTNIAAKELNATQTADLIKSGAVLAAKHAAALVAAYQVWQNADKLAKNESNAFKKKALETAAKTAAIASYRAASELINKSAMADLRYWNSLANNIRLGSANVPDGTYKLTIYSVSNGADSKVYEKEVTVKGSAFVDINL
ncbi:MAG: hypothetical protein LBV16_08370 [Elusimicrobiota bacterium]|jgi:hypothetical protein|nr:hypothetical protein [Elusimicrobiota bacterium]